MPVCCSWAAGIIFMPWVILLGVCTVLSWILGVHNGSLLIPPRNTPLLWYSKVAQQDLQWCWWGGEETWYCFHIFILYAFLYFLCFIHNNTTYHNIWDLINTIQAHWIVDYQHYLNTIFWNFTVLVSIHFSICFFQITSNELSTSSLVWFINIPHLHLPEIFGVSNYVESIYINFYRNASFPPTFFNCYESG